jgi:L-asparaginase II
MEQALAELAGEPVSAMAVDGCGAPVMAVSLAGLARAFGRLASAEAGTHERTVADAIRSHPAYVGGTRRDVSALVEGTPGLIAKDGAEAVYAVGLADGRGVALKVADGGQRARPVILAAALRRLGVESPALDALESAPVLGHGEPVGAVVAVGL